MKITIITVVRNAEKTILQALESVARQSYADIEHWVLDGASTDGTLKVIESFAKTHPNVRVRSQKDKGMYDALNQGIQLATGEVIGFLHADDFYRHDKVLEEVASVFKPNLEAVYSDLVYVDPTDTTQIKRFWQSKPFHKGDFGKGFCPPHPTFFVRKSTYDRLGGFDTSLKIGNDVELMMRFMEKHQIPTYYHPAIWVVMRLGGISNRSFKNIWQQNQVIMKAFAKNGLPFSFYTYIFYKFLDRASQFLKKPKREYA
mgnify:CR=1 FL=1